MEVTLKSTTFWDHVDRKTVQESLRGRGSYSKDTAIVCQSDHNHEVFRTLKTSSSLLTFWSGYMRNVLKDKFSTTMRCDDEVHVVMLPDFTFSCIKTTLEFLAKGSFNRPLSIKLYTEIMGFVQMLGIDGIHGAAYSAVDKESKELCLKIKRIKYIKRVVCLNVQKHNSSEEVPILTDISNQATRHSKPTCLSNETEAPPEQDDFMKFVKQVNNASIIEDAKDAKLVADVTRNVDDVTSNANLGSDMDGVSNMDDDASDMGDANDANGAKDPPKENKQKEPEVDKTKNSPAILYVECKICEVKVLGPFFTSHLIQHIQKALDPQNVKEHDTHDDQLPFKRLYMEQIYHFVNDTDHLCRYCGLPVKDYELSKHYFGHYLETQNTSGECDRCSALISV